MLPMSPTVQGVSGVRAMPGGGGTDVPGRWANTGLELLAPVGPSRPRRPDCWSCHLATLGSTGVRFGGMAAVGRHGWRKVPPDRRHPPHESGQSICYYPGQFYLLLTPAPHPGTMLVCPAAASTHPSRNT